MEGPVPVAQRRQLRLTRAVALLLAPTSFLLVVFALPMGRVLWAAKNPSAWAWVQTPYVGETLRVGLTQALWSTVWTLAIALPLAWMFHTRRFRAERLHLALHTAPFVMPVFVIVFGLQAVLGRSSALASWTGQDWLYLWGPLGAVVMAHAYYNYGFAARLIHVALERRPRRLEEAARSLGASPRQAFVRASLPLVLPSVGAVALLVFLFCFASFGTALLLGQGVVRTVETEIWGEATGLFPDYARGAVLGVIELSINALILGGYLLLRRRTPAAQRDVERRPPLASWWASTLAWIAAAVALAPLGAVLVGGFQLRGTWSLDPWRSLLQDHPGGFDLTKAIALSLLYAFGSIVVGIALCAALHYGSRGRPRLRKASEALASLPIAASGVLLGLAFVFAFGIGGTPDLFGSVWIVLLAHNLLTFPFLARNLMPALDAHDVRLDEAAALLGASSSSVAARIHWPLFRAPILVAAGFAAALSIGDFGASSVLMTPDTAGLTVWVGNVDGAFNPLFHARAVALAGLLCVFAILCFLAIEMPSRGRRGVAL
jgi:thiamine transport system permease protein